MLVSGLRPTATRQPAARRSPARSWWTASLVTPSAKVLELVMFQCSFQAHQTRIGQRHGAEFRLDPIGFVVSRSLQGPDGRPINLAWISGGHIAFVLVRLLRM